MPEKISLVPVTAPDCAGKMEIVAYYSPETRGVLTQQSMDMVSVEAFFEELCTGNGSYQYQTSMQGALSNYAEHIARQIPEFKALLDALLKDAADNFTLYKEGDEVCVFLEAGRGGVKVPHLAFVKKVASIFIRGKNQCSTRRNGKKTPAIIVKREIFVPATGCEHTVYENELMPLSTLHEFEEGEKITKAVKAKFTKEGIVGGHIVYKGRVFPF